MSIQDQIANLLKQGAKAKTAPLQAAYARKIAALREQVSK